MIKQRFTTGCLTLGALTLSLAALAAEPVRSFQSVKGNVSIQVLDQGEGKVIVILPSLGRGAHDYDEVAAQLAADGYRVLRPEPRGVNGSKAPMAELTLHDFAADVAQVLDEVKSGPAVVVGHAWGSQPARVLAVDRPDLVKGIVLAAASIGKLPPDSKEKPYGRLKEAINGSGNHALPEAQRLTYLKQAFFAPGNDPRPWLTGWYGQTHDAEGYARDHTPVDSYWSAGNQVPILDLQGEHDAVVIPNILKGLLGRESNTRSLPMRAMPWRLSSPRRWRPPSPVLLSGCMGFKPKLSDVAGKPLPRRKKGNWR